MQPLAVPSPQPLDLAQVRLEVEEFIYREADLADGHYFDEWFSLWTEDALYWVPANQDDIDPQKHVSIVYDDLDKIDTRLARLKGRRAHAQQPRSRLARVISNIRVAPGDSAGEVVATANFVLGEVRRGRQETWLGRVRYVLRRVDGRIKMAQKKVMLLGNDIPLSNMAFII
jgi:3-phenylpropionate/cinnamic acid dioxygenase small subunit